MTLDKCIQPSVDNTGKIVGLVAGDEECYLVCIIITLMYTFSSQCPIFVLQWCQLVSGSVNQ